MLKYAVAECIMVAECIIRSPLMGVVHSWQMLWFQESHIYLIPFFNSIYSHNNNNNNNSSLIVLILIPLKVNGNDFALSMLLSNFSLNNLVPHTLLPQLKQSGSPPGWVYQQLHLQIPEYISDFVWPPPPELLSLLISSRIHSPCPLSLYGLMACLHDQCDNKVALTGLAIVIVIILLF